MSLRLAAPSLRRLTCLRPIAPRVRVTRTSTRIIAAHQSRTYQTTPRLAMSEKNDQYSAAAETELPLNTKLTDLRAFLGKHKTVLLTTRAPNGALHSRIMAIAEITPDWKFRFIYDADSYKDKEVENDGHVNIGVDGMDKNEGWASIAGRASKSTDDSLVAKLYNPTIKAWFGDKGDGVHTGEVGDPRIAVFEIKVDEIRHYHQTKTMVGQVVDVMASAIGGKTATPGQIRTITGEDIASAWSKGDLKEA